MQEYNEPGYTGEPSPVATPPKPEPVFMIEGKEVPLGQLPPEVINEWYKTHTNRSEWQAANTKRAQDIAAQRKSLESLGNIDTVIAQVQQYQKFLDFLKVNPQLEQTIMNYMANPQQQQPGNQVSPEVMQLIQEQKKEISELKNQVTGLVTTGEQRQQNDERESAYKALSAKYPDLNRAEFEKFVDEQTNAAGDLENLYFLLHDAYRGKNTETIRADAQKQTLQNIQDRSKTVVDRGEGAPATQLPENVNLDKSLDDIFDDFAEETGNVEPPPELE